MTTWCCFRAARRVGYVGGEREGDADIFVADLRGFSEDLMLDLRLPGDMGYDIGQGTEIAGFERMHVLLGSGSDVFVGGDLDDVAFGGAGQDELSAGLATTRWWARPGTI